MVSEEFLNTKKYTLVSIHVLVKLEEKHVHDIKRPRVTASQISPLKIDESLSICEE